MKFLLFINICFCEPVLFGFGVAELREKPGVVKEKERRVDVCVWVFIVE